MEFQVLEMKHFCMICSIELKEQLFTEDYCEQHVPLTMEDKWNITKRTEGIMLVIGGQYTLLKAESALKLAEALIEAVWTSRS